MRGQSGRIAVSGWSAANDSLASEGKAPRTARGEKTLRKILDAALGEFGEKGFRRKLDRRRSPRRAKVALGTFYTYFDSKEAVFAALVGDMSRPGARPCRPGARRRRDGLDARAAGAARLSRLRRRPQGSLSDHRRGRIRRSRRVSRALRDHRVAHRRAARRRRRSAARCGRRTRSRPKCAPGRSWG